MWAIHYIVFSVSHSSLVQSFKKSILKSNFYWNHTPSLHTHTQIMQPYIEVNFTYIIILTILHEIDRNFIYKGI